MPAARNRAPWTGGAVAMLGVLLFAWARLVAQLDLLIDSLVLSLAGGALFIGGWRRLERFLLPLALLWLARPWPPMTIHVLQEEFQTLAGTLASAILSPVGTVVRSGHLLAYDGRLFQVIEGCSGLRSTVTLVFATLLYADLFSRSRRQTLGLVALAGVLGIGLNGLRVVWIAEI